MREPTPQISRQLREIAFTYTVGKLILRGVLDERQANALHDRWLRENPR